MLLTLRVCPVVLTCLHCVRLLHETRVLRDQGNVVGDQGNMVGDQGNVMGEHGQVEAREEIIITGGGDEMFVPGGIQIEDDHGYFRRHGSPSPDPPQQNYPPAAHVAHTTHIPTATHIPKKSCKGDYARALASLNNPPDVSQWIKLQIISKCILRAKGRGESQTAQSFAAEVKLRIQRWRRGGGGAVE